MSTAAATSPLPSSAIAAGNNLRHGLRSAAVLLPGDDPAEYTALLEDLTLHFAPGDLSELRCVREMADAEWRLRRVRRFTEDAVTRRIAALAPDHPDAGPITLQGLAIESLGPATGTSYATWLRYESKFERQYERAWRAWRGYQENARSVSAKEADIWMKQTIFSPSSVVPSPVERTGGLHPAAQLRRFEEREMTAACPAPVVFPERIPSAPPDSAPSPSLPDLEPAFTPDDDEAGLPPATPARANPNVQNHATPPQTPRNAPCPCGSREKFKRCCGKSAPPVLSLAA